MQEVARIEVDCEGIVGLWSDEARLLLGYSAGEMLGRSIEQLVPPEFQARHSAGFQRFIQTGVSRLPEISMTTALAKGGARVRLAISVEALRDTGGRIVGVGALMRAAD